MMAGMIAGNCSSFDLTLKSGMKKGTECDINRIVILQQGAPKYNVIQANIKITLIEYPRLYIICHYLKPVCAVPCGDFWVKNYLESRRTL